MDPHGIISAECLAAVRAFPSTIDESVLDALVAEDMATCLDHGVFESTLTDLTLEHRLPLLALGTVSTHS
jgi:hypothetical protein